MRFSTLFSAAAGLISLAIATPIELGAQTFSCDGTGLHAWPNNHGQATVGGTKQNIDHLDKVKTCKIPARGVLRIACAGGSAIYIRNFENKETSYSCNNYKASAQALMNKCSQGNERFGPAWEDGSRWATLLVGDNC